MPGLQLFKKGFYSHIGANQPIVAGTINLGATKGRGSSTRMFNYCNQRSANPSECINQFTNVASTPTPTPPTPPTPTSDTTLVYNTTQGSSFVWDTVTFTLDTNLPNFSYTSTTTSIPATTVPSVANLIAVTIGNIVTSIGQLAFLGCSALASVTFASISTLTSIGQAAFQQSGLTSITIPTSVTTIGISAFNTCFSLTSINVDTSNTNYSSLDGVLFNKLQTTLIQCPGGKSGTYTIPNSVTSIGYRSFLFCIGLTSITIPASVTSIDEAAFQSCSNLTGVTIPTSVITIGKEAFQSCSLLASVTIGNSVQTIGLRAFQTCPALESIAIPASVTTIDGNAFQFSGLLNVTIATNPSQAISGIIFTAGTTVTFFGKNGVNIVYP